MYVLPGAPVSISVRAELPVDQAANRLVAALANPVSLDLGPRVEGAGPHRVLGKILGDVRGDQVSLWIRPDRAEQRGVGVKTEFRGQIVVESQGSRLVGEAGILDRHRIRFVHAAYAIGLTAFLLFAIASANLVIGLMVAIFAWTRVLIDGRVDRRTRGEVEALRTFLHDRLGGSR